MTNTEPAPLLSVTVTNYNYGSYLSRNIESILAQSFTDYELLIIDNASSDDSLDVIRHYADLDPRVRLIAHDVNQGALASFRESCDVARGRYRVQVDADDWVSSADSFAKQISVLESNPMVTFAFSVLVMKSDGCDDHYVFHPYRGDRIMGGEVALEAVLGFSLGHSGMMIRLDRYHESGGYPTGFKYYDDMLLAVHLCELGDVAYIDEHLYTARQHSANEHLDPDVKVVRDEVLPIIAIAFNGTLSARLSDAAAMRRRIVKRALVHHATFHIFSGRPRQGWRLYWESVKCKPRATIFQRATLSLLARAVLGERRYNKAVRTLKQATDRSGLGRDARS